MEKRNFKMTEKAIEEVNHYFSFETSRESLMELIVEGYEELNLLLDANDNDVSGAALRDILFNLRLLADAACGK